MTSCPSREQLASCVEGRPGDGLRAEIQTHARSCPKCRSLLGSLGGDDETETGTVDLAPVVAAPIRRHSGWDDQTDLGIIDPKPAEAASIPAVPDWDDDTDMGAAVAQPFAGPDRERLDGDGATQMGTIGPDQGDTIEQTAISMTGKPSRRPDGQAGLETIEMDSAPEETLPFQVPAMRRTASQPAAARPATCRPIDHDSTLPEEAASESGETTEFGATEPSKKRSPPRPAPGPGRGGTLGPESYEILGELGRGGMGVVYKAIHRRLNRPVALKMIRGADHASEIQLVRFRIEAEAVASLHHPNILQIYDIGEFDGSPYVALELLEGGSLLDRLKGSTLSPKQAAEWMVPLSMAMEAAHRAGIVHRDIKSANILFSADGVPKVTDFGLAKRLEADEGQTQTGQVMGTPSYMAPEQARGDTKTVGPAADIYALGTILYEMLTGRPPFKGASAMATVKQVIEVDPVSPSRIQYHIPRDLETICMKCLQKEPRKRYASAKALADDLNRYLTGEPILARRTPPVERGIKWTRRHPTYATLIALGTLAAIGTVAAGVWYSNYLRTQERLAARHESEVRDQTADDLMRARDAISGHDLTRAQAVLAARKAVLDRENRRVLASLRDRTSQMLSEVEQGLAADRAREAAELANKELQARYRHFLDRRKEALFRDTQFTGLMLPTSLDLTRKAAEEALVVFARRDEGDDWTLGDLSGLSGEERAEVTEGSYELLLVLAEALATQDPAQVDRALRSLDSAKRLRPAPTRAYHLRRASCLARKRDAAGESRELAQADRILPETAFDHFLSGQQLYKRGRFPEAIQDLESALRIKPDHFWAGCLLAICYIQTARYEAAKSCLNAGLQTDPDFAWLYLLRGFASGQLAVKYLGMVEGNPGREKALKAAAEFEFKEAEADLREALARLDRTPDDVLRYQALVNRGLIRFQRGRIDEAASDYREAVALNKKDPFLAHAELAHVCQKKGDLAGAIEQFTRAIELKPDWAPLYRGRAEVRQHRGDQSPQDRAAALADLDMAIRLEKPDNDVLALDHTNRGKLLYQDDRLDGALEEIRLALKMLPDHVEAHVLRIRVLLKQRRYDEVIHSCDAALAAGRKSPLLFELRGLAREKQHDYPAAIRDYTRALEIRPDDGSLLVRRGWVYVVFDSSRLALDDFNAAIKLNPAEGDAYNGRGTAHVRLGDHRAAVTDAREALRLGGTSPRVTYGAARIYAMAATVAAAEAGEKGRSSRLLPSRYQDIAVKLIRDALAREAPEKRESFWRETIQNDPALKPIRRRLRFDELIADNKKASS